MGCEFGERDAACLSPGTVNHAGGVGKSENPVYLSGKILETCQLLLFPQQSMDLRKKFGKTEAFNQAERGMGTVYGTMFWKISLLKALVRRQKVQNVYGKCLCKRAGFLFLFFNEYSIINNHRWQNHQRL